MPDQSFRMNRSVSVAFIWPSSPRSTSTTTNSVVRLLGRMCPSNRIPTMAQKKPAPRDLTIWASAERAKRGGKTRAMAIKNRHGSRTPSYHRLICLIIFLFQYPRAIFVSQKMPKQFSEECDPRKCHQQNRSVSQQLHPHSVPRSFHHADQRLQSDC